MNCFLRIRIRFVFLIYEDGIMDFKELYEKERPYAIEVLKKLIRFKSVLDEYKENSDAPFGIENKSECMAENIQRQENSSKFICNCDRDKIEIFAKTFNFMT